MKKNDWIVASINNPEFTTQDYKDVLGMTEDNTLMLSAEDYEKSDFIKNNPNFADKNGDFDKKKFEDFYKAKLAEFGNFNESNPVTDNFEYSLFDTRQKSDSRVKDPNFQIETISNPDRIQVGMAGRNIVGDRKWSQSELAQTQKVFDSKTGEYRDYTPNDMSASYGVVNWAKHLFDDPLVLAQWDSDGTHIDPVYGVEVKHKKGDAKLNDDGQYYYETLNGGSTVGKQVLSAFDVLTIDGQGGNKYDFMDSDGLDKSVAGTITKTALAVAPMFIPYVGEAYSGLLIAREMGKSMPMLYGMLSSVWGNTEDSQVLNTIAAVGNKFSTGTSDYSKQNTFTFENISNMLADVALLWGQQKLIAKSIQNVRSQKALLGKAEKQAKQLYNSEVAKLTQEVEQGRIAKERADELKGLEEYWQHSIIGIEALKKYQKPVMDALQKRARIGADASLVYMSIVSNTDVYATMLEHGASKRDASLVALASTLGMFSVDKYLGLGELFLDDMFDDTMRQVRGTITKQAKGWAKSLIGSGTGTDGLISAKAAEQSKVSKLFNKAFNFGKKSTEKAVEGVKTQGAVSKYFDDMKLHSLGFLGKSLGEGLEEVNEELVTDCAKQIYEWAGEFNSGFSNILNQSGIKDVGAWDNAFDRYMMSFLGGAAGGSVFYGVDLVQNGGFHRDESQDELIYILGNDNIGKFKEELYKQWKKGRLGSTTLSATKFDTDENGKRVYLSAENEADSQNTFVYNKILDTVDQLQTIVKGEGVDYSEDDLFRQMVLEEDRLLRLQSYLKDASYTTKYLETFRGIVKNLANAVTDLTAALQTVEGTANGTKLTDDQKRDRTIMDDPTRLANIESAKQNVEQWRAERDKFLSAEASIEYTDKMLFAIDEYLNAPFISMTFDQWVENNKHKKTTELTQSEFEQYKEEYLQYKLNSQALDLDLQYTIYKNIKGKIDPIIGQLVDGSATMKETSDKIAELLSDINSPFYDIKETPIIPETETSTKVPKKVFFSSEKLRRLNEIIDEIIRNNGGSLDPSTRRLIHNNLSVRRPEVVKLIIEQLIEINPVSQEIAERFQGFEKTNKEVLLLLSQIKEDGSNLQEIKDGISKKLRDPLIFQYDQKNVRNAAFKQALIESMDETGFTYDESNITGKTLVDFMQYIKEKVDNDDPEIKAWFDKNSGDRVLYESIKNSDNVIEDFLEYDPNASSYKFLDKIFDKDNHIDWSDDDQDNIAEIVNEIRNHQEEDLDLFNYNTYSNDEINSIIDTAVNDLERHYFDLSDTMLNEIENNEVLKLFNLIDAKVQQVDPVKFLIKSLTQQVLGNNEDVEEILERLYNEYENAEDPEQFQILDADETILAQAKYVLQLAKSYLYAASTKVSSENPIGHNVMINQFVRHAKSSGKMISDRYANIEDLPEMSEDVATMYINEINKYLAELDENSPLSLLSISNANKINKPKRLLKANIAFKKTFLEFFSTNRAKFKFKFNDEDVDLLEGIDDIDPNLSDSQRLHKIEDLYYINLHNLMAKGVSFKDILKNSKILENVCDAKGGLEDILLQKTVQLDEKLEYSKLSGFDTFTYLLTISGISSNNFNNFIKLWIQSQDNIVPLQIQLYASRIGLAQLEGADIFSDAIEYIEDVTGNKLPSLENIVFVDGSAGVGKTSVIAKSFKDYAKNILGYSDDQVLLLAPKVTQLKNLETILENPNGMTRQKESGDEGIKGFFETLLDPNIYQEIMLDITTPSVKKKHVSFKKVNGSQIATLINPDSLKFNDKLNPKIIIIDEITHFSNVELQILSAWAKKKGIKILGLGDSNQNGFANKSTGCLNVDREVTFMIRSQKLSISLRDVNILKLTNLTILTNTLNELQNLDSNGETDQEYFKRVNAIKNSLNRIHFRVYNSNITINGDLITKTLSKEDAGKLAGTVAYIGDSNSETLNVLKSNGEITIIDSLTPETIQGQEFDYIVVDKQWSYKPGDDEKGAKMLNLLQDLYTLMSRGKIGSIFIDNGLSNIIGKNKLEFIKADAPNLKDAVDVYRQNALEELESLDLIDPESFNGMINTPTTSTPPSPTIPPSSTPPPSSPTPATPEESTAEPEPETPPAPYSVSGSGPTVEEILETPEVEEEEPEPEPEPETSEEYYDGIEDTEQPEAEDEENHFDEIVKDLELDALENAETTLENNLDLDPSVKIRVYSSASFSGYARNDKNEYSIPKDGNGILRDLLVITDSIPKTGQEKNQAVEKLLAFKSMLTYGHEYNGDKLGYILSQDEYTNMKHYIEVRPKRSFDNFVGYSGLDEDNLLYNELVFAHVVEFTNVDGKKCRVTLGLLANPDTFLNYAQKISKQPEVISHAIQYKNLLDRIKSKFNTASENGELLIPITPNFSRLTYIRRTSQGHAITEKVLEGGIRRGIVHQSTNPNDNIDQSPKASFKRSHPYIRISRPYIYTGLHFRGISDSIRGKAVVFVSADMSRTFDSDDEMVREYIAQKEATNILPDRSPFNLIGTSPSIRMIPLNPQGVTLWELSLTSFAEKLFSEDVKIGGKNTEEQIVEQKFPFEEDYMGMRMFASMWNWRANLIKFGEKLEKFEQENGYSDEQVDNIALSITEGELLPGVTNEDVKKLQEFNDNLGSEVRLFRIGGVGKVNGFFIGKLNVSPDNEFYKGIKSPTGIYLTPKKYRQFRSFTDILFNNFLSKIVQLKQADGSDFSPRLHVTTKKSEDGKIYQNSLANLLSKGFSDGEIELEDNGKTWKIKVPGKQQIVQIPILMTKLILRIRILQNPDIEYEDDKGVIRIFQTINGNQVEVKFDNLDYNLIYKLLNHSDEDYRDASFDNMISLMFHGTVLDVRDKSVIRASDAYFKQGFLVDPFGSANIISGSTGNSMFKQCINNPVFFKVNCEIDMPVYDVSLEEIEKNFDEILNPHPVETVSKEDLTASGLDVFAEAGMLSDDDIKKAEECKTIEEARKVIHDATVRSIKNNFEDYFNGLHDTKTLDSIIIGYDVETGLLISLLDFLKNQYPDKISENLNYTWVDGKMLVLLNDNEIIEVKYNQLKEFDFIETSLITKGDNSEVKQLENVKIAVDNWYARVTEKYKEGNIDEEEYNKIKEFVENTKDCDNVVSFKELHDRISDLVNIDEDFYPEEFLSMRNLLTC